MDTVGWPVQGLSGYRTLNPPDLVVGSWQKSRESSGLRIKTLIFFLRHFHNSVTTGFGHFVDNMERASLGLPLALCSIGEEQPAPYSPGRESIWS